MSYSPLRSSSKLAVKPTCSQVEQMPAFSPKVRSFKRGEIIPLSSQGLWRIERGAVRTLTWDDGGTAIALGIWGKGDVVGKPLSRIETYEVDCLTDVLAVLLPPEQWHLSVDSLLHHAQQAEVLTTIIRHERVRFRLQHLLSWLAEKFGRPVERGKLIALRLSHQIMAEILGVSRVTVTRMLKQFESEGLIIRHRRELVLCKH